VIKKRSEIMNKTLKEILKALAPPKDWWIIILIFGGFLFVYLILHGFNLIEFIREIHRKW
jgi:hypothetical protein